MKLFKYKKVDKYSKQIFVDRKIWYSYPSEFNDPFDCGIDISLNMSLKEKMEVLKTMMSQHLWTKDKITKQLQSSLDQRRGQLNDLAEKNILKKRDAAHEHRDNTGILSLSSSENNVLMWSHYADEHKGFCIEFEVDTFTSSISKVN